MKLNKYLPFALIYFFINSLALPFGLTYTTLLAPLFYIWILLVRKKEVLLPFIAILLPFVIAHIITGVESQSYTVSFLNLLLVYVFCQAVYTFLVVCKNPEDIFGKILVINFILCLLAGIIYFTPYANLLWMEQGISGEMGQFSRMKLFTYEPSYYATLFTPIFLFYFLQYLFGQNEIQARILLPMLFLPYILSFSVGVIGSVLLSCFLTWILYFHRLTRKRRILNTIINSGAALFSAIVLIALFFRNSIFFSRMTAIFSGKDSSGNGRTIDAFILSGKIIKGRNEYWGIGVGQVKIAGQDIIRNYYLYYQDNLVAIPNAAAETLTIFGWTGFLSRIFIEIFLFFATRVWTNYYRLLLFFFMFIYQFTGSFITNVAEYVIWILAFTNVFYQFDVKFAGNFQKFKRPLPLQAE